MENKLLIIVVITLFLIALAQLMKIYGFASKMTGEKSEEKVTRGENIFMGNLMLVFMILLFGFIIWLMIKYGLNAGLYKAGSVHGEKIDNLLIFNWWVIIPTFFLTNGMLFIFSWKYSHREERKALYLTHNNKLEIVWTIVPAIVLTGIIIYGLKTWNDIMYKQEKGQVIEVFSYQFGWITRYAGEDNDLGKADYKMITSSNPLGVINQNTIDEVYIDLEKKIKDIDSTFKVNQNEKGEYYLPDSKVDELNEKRERYNRQMYRIIASIDQKGDNESTYKRVDDDIIVQEIHLIKNQPYTFIFRSKDVIHCPWFPHLRAQINAVPGMETSFRLTPTITTKEMRSMPEVQEHYKNINEIHNERKRRLGEEEEKVEFDYILLCNKICGAGHSNMQLKVVVETQEEFKEWIENKGDKKRLTIGGKEVNYWGDISTESEL